MQGNYAVDVKTLRLALDYELIQEKVGRVIKFNQKAWLKPCIDINIELRTKTKTYFENDFFKLMSNSVFEKTYKEYKESQEY